MMETGCMVNYDGDRLYSNTIMKNIVWITVVLNCTTETWSACTSMILVVTRYDSCGGRLVQVRFLCQIMKKKKSTFTMIFVISQFLCFDRTCTTRSPDPNIKHLGKSS